MNPSRELARRIKAHTETSGQGYREIAEAAGLRGHNRLWRFVHEGECPENPLTKAGEDRNYGVARFTLDEIHALCGVIGCGLADLDASKPTESWADVEKAVDALPELSDEGRRLLLEAARAMYAAAVMVP